MRRAANFFQVGGALSEDAPSYIERPADAELLAALERHEYCLVLAPRQMGKSSLMVHAMARLKQKGIASAVVDLQPLGNEPNFERWFTNVIYQITRNARLKTNTKEWWERHQYLGPTQRFMAFLDEIVLREIESDVMLFFDEIDSVLPLPFADDFFTTIRSLYNARAVNPALERLMVVLLGVASPSAFIKDRTRTPFNIGESIRLTDFSKDKTTSFQAVLGPGSEQLVDRIFYWTNGQPLLVQKLAAAAYSWPPEARTSDQVDREVEQSYLNLKIEQDTHFKFIQDYLLDPASKVRQTLSLYRDVLAGAEVEDNEQSPEQERLKLAGVVRVEQGRLAPRNRIYEHVFDLDWVRAHLPVDSQKWLAYGVAATLALVLVGVLGVWRFMANGDGSLLGRPLRVGIVTWPGYAGGLVANNGFKPNKDCIFWNGHKQTVEFLLIEDADVRAKAFAKGGEDGVDIVWSTVDYWAYELPGFVKDGTKARAIMQVDWSRGGDAIVADQSIKTIEDLKGKKISLVLYTPSHWLLEYSLENSKLNDLEQAEIVKNLVGKNASPDARADFVHHEVDAAVVWEPDVTRASLERLGDVHILFSTKTAANLIAQIMVAREDFIKDHPDVIKAFVQGWLEGAVEANRKPDKVVKLLIENEALYKYLGEPMTKESLQTVKLADLTDNTRMFGLDGKSEPLFNRIFAQAGQAWVKRGYIPNALPPDGAVDLTFLKECYAQMPVTVGEEFTGFDKTKPPVDVAPIMSKPVTVTFATGSAMLDPTAKQALDPIITLIKTMSNAYIRVEGNTDNSCNPATCRSLSQQRAQAVADYLVRVGGVDKSRFDVVGNGDSVPFDVKLTDASGKRRAATPAEIAASNSTDAGRAQNRRTEIQIIPR